MMKKIILFTLLAIMFLGCKKEEKPIDESPYSSIEKSIDELGIKPSNIKDIKSLGFVADSSTYKLVGGMMNNNAWIAKFDSNGNEIFSYTAEDTFGELKNSYVVHSSIKYIDENLIMFVLYITDNPEPPPYYSNNYNYASRLCVINFNSGEGISKFSFNNESISDFNGYKVFKNQYSFLIQFYGIRYISKYYSVSLDGKSLWERELSESEIPGIDYYELCTFLDTENIVYKNNKSFRSINLKDYTLNYDFDILLPATDPNRNDVFYEIKNISVSDNLIIIEYDEQYRTEVIDDPISGASHIEYTLLNKYFYEVDKKTGEIINHGTR